MLAEDLVDRLRRERKDVAPEQGYAPLGVMAAESIPHGLPNLMGLHPIHEGLQSLVGRLVVLRHCWLLGHGPNVDSSA